MQLIQRQHNLRFVVRQILISSDTPRFADRLYYSTMLIPPLCGFAYCGLLPSTLMSTALLAQLFVIFLET